jgi:hypothetical protein
MWTTHILFVFVAGRDLFVLDLRTKIDKEAWGDVLKLFLKQSVAQVMNPSMSAVNFTDSCFQEGSAKAQVNLDIKVSELEKELNIPMEVHTPFLAAAHRHASDPPLRRTGVGPPISRRRSPPYIRSPPAPYRCG